jgi:hypothetical protein
MAFFCAGDARAATYEVGPGKPYTNIGDVPLESLGAGDTVKIYYRTSPYKEKWVVTAQGTQANPVKFEGVLGGGGTRRIERPARRHAHLCHFREPRHKERAHRLLLLGRRRSAAAVRRQRIGLLRRQRPEYNHPQLHHPRLRQRFLLLLHQQRGHRGHTCRRLLHL